jgi:hypothetical protein
MRGSHKWAVVLSLWVPIVGTPGVAVAAAPVDVERLNQAATLIEQAGQRSTVDEAAYTSAFVDIALAQVLIVVDHDRLPQGARLASTEFREFLRDRVSKQVRPAVAAAPSKRVGALYDALAAVANRRFAERVLTDWLATPALGHLGKAAVTAMDEKEAEQSAEADKVNPPDAFAKARRDALTAAKADDKVGKQRMDERFRRQFNAGEVRGALRVLSDGVELVSDTGGPGSDNGLIDAGEWVTFHIPVTNTGDKPYFSASAWVRAEHECAWSGLSREIVLDEMGDGGKTTIPVRAYFSEACPDRTRVPFTIEVRDSVRTTEAGAFLPVYLTVTNIGRGVLVDPRFDRDEPGTSDGKLTRRLEPDTSAELSTGFELDRAGAERVLQSWGVAKSVEELSGHLSYRMGETMLRDASGLPRYAPYDDLDLQIREKDAYDRAIKAIASREQWAVPEDAGGVAVVETVVDFPGLEGAWAPTEKIAMPPKPAEPPKPPPVPSADQALAAFTPFVKVEARAVKPDDGALAAASSQVFDATVDEASFKLAWCRLTTVREPGAPDPCEPNPCPTPPPPVKVTLEQIPAFREPARYVFRNLVWLDAAWSGPNTAQRVPDPPPPPAASEEPELPAPPPAPPVVREKPAVPKLMASLYGELGNTSLVSNAQALSWSFLTSSVATPTLGLDLSLGGKFRGHAGLALPMRMNDALPVDTVPPSPSVSAIQVHGGGGYLVPLAAPIDLESIARLGWTRSVVNGLEAPAVGAVVDADVFFEVEEAAHWRVAKPVSLFAALGYRVAVAQSLSGVVTTGSFFENSGVKFKIGASYRY